MGGEFQDVTASWVFQLHRSVRICEDASVARMLEMIEDVGGVHGDIVGGSGVPPHFSRLSY